MSNDKNMNAAVFEILEQINEKQDKILKAQPDSEKLSALTAIPKKLGSHVTATEACAERTEKSSGRIETCTEQIETAAKAVTDALAKPVEHIHRNLHTLDIHSNWVLYTLIGLVLWTFLSLYIIDRQRDNLTRHRDNDLKYRYIRMKGGITAEGVSNLQAFFGYERDEAEVKNLRHTVEQYEQAIAEQVERTEQAHLNAIRAEQLKQEAEALKNKK